MKNKEIQEKRAKIVKGLEKAYEKLVQFKIYKNSPIISSKNGKVIKLDPNKVSPTTKYKWY